MICVYQKEKKTLTLNLNLETLSLLIYQIEKRLKKVLLELLLSYEMFLIAIVDKLISLLGGGSSKRNDLIISLWKMLAQNSSHDNILIK